MLQLLVQLLEGALFYVYFRFKVGHCTPEVSFHPLLFFFELLLNATDLKFHVGSDLSCSILIICLVLL